MGYFVADSYKGYEIVGKPFEKGSRLYTKAKCKCDRCVKGIFPCRVENNMPVPHPAYGGICLKCGGTGFLIKEIRLYTEKEYLSMQRSKEKAAEARQKKNEEKAFAAQKKWFEYRQFNDNKEVYIAIGDTYSIKEQLKEDGFKFNGELRRWVRNNNEGYENKTIKMNFSDLYDNLKYIKDDAIEKISEKEVQKLGNTEDYVGEIKERLDFMIVTLERIGEYEGYYGYSYIYTFKDKEGHIFTWFTAKDIEKEVGEQFYLKGTVKEHKIYQAKKQTILSRCIIKEEI